VIYHKTGNTIEIVKDPEVAEQVNQMARRTGFGVMKGMTGGSRRQPIAQPSTRTLQPVPPSDKVLSRRPLETDMEGVGQEAMQIAEIDSIDSAVKHIQQAHRERRILQKQAEQLIQIISHVLQHEHRS